MPEKETISLEEILNHPTVKKATDDVNAESLERRAYSPLRCEVFSHPYTVLRETDRYRFELDRQAEKLLPDIIANKVQLVEGKDSVDDEVARQYGKKRHIGIVFSGGPAPGGHNVIAVPLCMTPPRKSIRIQEFTDFWSGLTGSLKMKPSSLVMIW